MGYFFVPWWEEAGGKTVWGIVAGVAGTSGNPGLYLREEDVGFLESSSFYVDPGDQT